MSINFADLPRTADVSTYHRMKLYALGAEPTPGPGVEAAEAACAKKSGQQPPAVPRPAGTIEQGGIGEADVFGDLKRVQSAYEDDRPWSEIGTLDESMVGKDVWIRARLHVVRAKGRTAFMVLRKGFNSVQAIVEDGSHGMTKEAVKYAGKIPHESIVDVYGEVVKAAQDVLSTSQSKVEMRVRKLFGVSIGANTLPFQLEDAARPEPKAGTQTTAAAASSSSSDSSADKDKKKAAQSNPTVGQDLRLNNRWIDLRTPANHAIFRLQSRVCQYFRQYFIDHDFVEIHTPKLTPGVSEGGANVFKLKYLNNVPACLAQSPQLYKQMAVSSDLTRVFEIGPVFRAEDSNTHRHMCEFTGMDFEMEIKQHYHEILHELGDCLVSIFDNINKNCQKELAAVNAQYPFEPLKYRPMGQTLVIPFPEAVKMLREDGIEMGDFDDFTTPQEKHLGVLVKRKYDVDFYIVDRYPLGARPFYTMPCADDPRYTNSYDVFLRGEEITSGAQRIHEVELLKQRASECGIPLSNLASYLESFKYGAWPHGGAGIGMERVVMLFLGLNNIRKTSMFPRTPDRIYP